MAAGIAERLEERLGQCQPEAMSMKKRATWTRDLFVMMSNEFDNVNSCCVLRRYLGVRRIVKSFTSQSVLHTMERLSSEGIESLHFSVNLTLRKIAI